MLAAAAFWRGNELMRDQAQSQAQLASQSGQGAARYMNSNLQKERDFKSPVMYPPDADIRWPLNTQTQSYASIDGEHLREFVKDQIDISHRSRDRGEQLWGRITGTQADAEAAQWFRDKLRQVGVADVHQVALDLPPQSVAKSWEVSVSGNGRTMPLESSVAARGAPGTNGTTLDVEAVYVGMGSAAEFAGRDVKGKAVFIYSQTLPGPWQLSSTRLEAAKRAEDLGAAAVFNIIGEPGNFRTVVGASTKVPGFTLGAQDGAAVREMIEQSPPGQAPHVKIRSDVEMVAGEKTSIVWGVIPGMTDEKIVINAHRDGYYEAADDNASGVAAALGLAEYYAKMPKEKRRRTIIIVGNSGHHNTPVSSQYLVAHKDEFFSKAALLINCEHVGQIGTDLYGFRIVATNMPSNFMWYVGGGPKLQPIAVRDLDQFGISRFAEKDPAPPGDIGLTYQLAPSVQLIQVPFFYHTDHDTLDTISPAVIESVTRAYAKIIDDVNKEDLKDLAWPSVMPKADLGGEQ